MKAKFEIGQRAIANEKAPGDYRGLLTFCRCTVLLVDKVCAAEPQLSWTATRFVP